MKMEKKFFKRGESAVKKREIACQPFPKRQILDSSKLKEFADHNFNFDENGRKFFK